MFENLLSSDGFIIVNKKLIQELGLQESIMIGELYAEYNYWLQEGKLTTDGFFYSTHENIEKNTTLTDYQQRRVTKKLIELGIITTKRMGNPAKLYYKINEDSVVKFLNIKTLKNLTSRPKKIKVQDAKKFKVNNNKEKEINKNNNKNIHKTKKDKYLDLVISKLCEYDFSDDVKNKIIDYYSDQIDRNNKPANNQMQVQFDELSKHCEAIQIKAINKAIAGGWKSMLYGLENKSTAEHFFTNSDSETYEEHQQRVMKLSTDTTMHKF